MLKRFHFIGHNYYRATVVHWKFASWIVFSLVSIVLLRDGDLYCISHYSKTIVYVCVWLYLKNAWVIWCFFEEKSNWTITWSDLFLLSDSEILQSYLSCSADQTNPFQQVCYPNNDTAFLCNAVFFSIHYVPIKRRLNLTYPSMMRQPLWPAQRKTCVSIQ